MHRFTDDCAYKIWFEPANMRIIVVVYTINMYIIKWKNNIFRIDRYRFRKCPYVVTVITIYYYYY